MLPCCSGRACPPVVALRHQGCAAAAGGPQADLEPSCAGEYAGLGLHIATAGRCMVSLAFTGHSWQSVPLLCGREKLQCCLALGMHTTDSTPTHPPCLAVCPHAQEACARLCQALAPAANPLILPLLPHMLQFARMRREYVPAYAEHLRQLAAGQSSQRIERLPAPVVEMDRQLPEQTILMFRWAR